MQQSQEPRAVSAQQQQELKQTLREAFAGNDGVNCWAWVIFDHEVTVSATNEAASERGELNADEVHEARDLEARGFKGGIPMSQRPPHVTPPVPHRLGSLG